MPPVPKCTVVVITEYFSSFRVNVPSSFILCLLKPSYFRAQVNCWILCEAQQFSLSLSLFLFCGKTYIQLNAEILSELSSEFLQIFLPVLPRPCLYMLIPFYTFINDLLLWLIIFMCVCLMTL